MQFCEQFLYCDYYLGILYYPNFEFSLTRKRILLPLVSVLLVYWNRAETLLHYNHKNYTWFQKHLETNWFVLDIGQIMGKFIQIHLSLLSPEYDCRVCWFLSYYTGRKPCKRLCFTNKYLTTEVLHRFKQKQHTQKKNKMEKMEIFAVDKKEQSRQTED